MYYVKLYNDNNDMIVDAPFHNKQLAIAYFNLRCDSASLFDEGILRFKRIEIYDDKTCLFDYEV